MRSVLILCLLFLAGCASQPPAQSSGGIKAVQSAAVQICRFLPAAETVANLFLSGNALMMTAEAMANAICRAVTTAPLADGRGRRLAINGVVIKGRFVR
jgi:hypothetical protein